MIRDRTPRDDEPFDANLPGRSLLSIGRPVSDEAAAARALRERVEGWARARGFAVADSRILASIDGVDVEVPLYSMTADIAIVRGATLARVEGTLSLEPPSLASRLARDRRTSIGDAELDRRFIVRASDDDLARRLVDDGVRAALLACDACWRARLSADARVQVELDTPSMTGAVLLTGMRLVAAMARATVERGAYR